MRKKALLASILVAAAFLAHSGIFAFGLDALHSDFAPGWITAAGFREGRWSAFYFNMPYAGVTLGVVRAAWCAVFEALARGPESFLLSQSVFTYAVTPALLALGVFVLVQAYCSLLAAFGVALIVAFGLQFLVTNYGNDPYFAYLILGCGLLAIRARVRNPVRELSGLRLFGVGALAGLLVYTSRASLIFVAAFLLDWQWARGELRKLLRPADWLERVLLGLSVFFLALFLYLEVFGPELGAWGGRPVRVHATPNLHYAAILLIALELKIRWRAIDAALLRRFAVLGTGLAAGFLPELVHWIALHQSVSAQAGGNHSFPDTIKTLGLLPQALRELLTAGEGWGAQATLLLLLASLAAFTARARADFPRFQALVVTGVLSVYGFCRVFTYTSGTPRYLLPVLPVLAVAAGCLLDDVRRRGWAVRALVAGLALAHLAHHWQARQDWIAVNRESGRHARIMAAIDAFRKAGVDLVISDDYWWHSNNYSAASRGQPLFLPPTDGDLTPPGAVAMAAAARKVGFLLSPAVAHHEEDFFGRRWSVRHLADIGDRALYIQAE